MELWGSVIGVTAIAGMGGTGLGGLAACLFRRDSGRAVSLLLSFAAGVMISVVCFDLLGDAAQETAAGGGLLLVAAGVLAGCAVICLLNGVIASCPEGKSRRGGLFLAGMVMAAAIALHNVPEGMVIGASFARGTDAGSGMAAAVVIGAHNVPEGMAVAVPLRSGGMSRVRTVLTAALTGAPTVAGAVLGCFLGTMSPTMLTLSLSFASGAMLYVVFGELLPESAGLWQSKAPALTAILGILAGLLLIRI